MYFFGGSLGPDTGLEKSIPKLSYSHRPRGACMLEAIYLSMCCGADTTLPDRFKEREESVKVALSFESQALSSPWTFFPMSTTYILHIDDFF